jgi:hypothetical protein
MAPWATKAERCAMPMTLISLRISFLPWSFLPYGDMSATWLMKPEVQAWPPVLE